MPLEEEQESTVQQQQHYQQQHHQTEQDINTGALHLENWADGDSDTGRVKETTSATTTASSPVHFCFIVHGHQGRPTDLSYLHHTVKAKAHEHGIFAHTKSSESCVVGRGGKVSADAPVPLASAGKIEMEGEKVVRRKKRDRFSLRKNRNNNESRTHNNPANDKSTDESADESFVPNGKYGQMNDVTKGALIVHNVACNEGKTNDGIIKGGTRLVNEMLDVIRSEVGQQGQSQGDSQSIGETVEPPVDVTISMVGNSLGGLYGRYAIAHLSQVLGDLIPNPSEQSSPNNESHHHYLFDGRIRIHLNVFCSTASPHLGCANHTFVPIPRTAEIGVARVIGETGSDLFRLNNLVHKMATSPDFLRPLSSFRKRIAYANAYRTDFPVPGSTAAFLDKESDSPHYFEEYFGESDSSMGEGGDAGLSGAATITCPASEKELIVATLYTPKRSLHESVLQQRTTRDERGEVDNLTIMSSSLDALGWKKVFVDIRNEIPLMTTIPSLKTLPMPSLIPTSSKRSDDGSNGVKGDCPIRRLRSYNQKKYTDDDKNHPNNQPVTSRDLIKAISSSPNYQLSLPLGHNAICAFSRGSFSTVVNAGGRPVMDSLAIDLTKEISLWSRGTDR